MPPTEPETMNVSVLTVVVSVFLFLAFLFLVGRCGSVGSEEAADPAPGTSTAPGPEQPEDAEAPGTAAVPLGDISGVWEAPIQGDQDWYDVRLDIAAAADGSGWVVGVDYPQLNCGGFFELSGTESGGHVLVGAERLEFGRLSCADGGLARMHRTEEGHLYWEVTVSDVQVWAETRRTSEREPAEDGRDHRFEPLPGTAEANGSGGTYLLPGFGEIEAPTGFRLIRYERSPITSVTFWDGHEGLDHSFALRFLVDGEPPHSVSADQLIRHWDWPRYDYGGQEPPALVPPPYDFGDPPA